MVDSSLMKVFVNNLQITIIFCNFATNKDKMGQKENKEKEKTSRETLGKFFYDLAKTSFASMVVGDVVAMFLREHLTDSAIGLFVIGVFATAIFAGIGFKILKM